jgi:hypothetical protein
MSGSYKWSVVDDDNLLGENINNTNKNTLVSLVSSKDDQQVMKK